MKSRNSVILSSSFNNLQDYIASNLSKLEDKIFDLLGSLKEFVECDKESRGFPIASQIIKIFGKIYE